LKLVNLAIKQLNNNAYNHNNDLFFSEYFRIFNTNQNFEVDTKSLMKMYNEHDTYKAISFLKSTVQTELSKVKNYLNIDTDLHMVTFFGDCSYDGHGMLIKGKPYVFFDLNAIIPRIDFYNFNVFATHEILHAIHYYLNPEFYQLNHRTIEEKYLKLLLSEGIATHLSHVITKENKEDAYWFGYLEPEQVLHWINNCENMKKDISHSLHETIHANEFNNLLFNRLFGIDDFTKPTSYRLGYYYGSEIIKKFLQEKHVRDVLTLSYEQARKRIYNYFDF